MKPISCIDAGEVNSQQSKTIPPSTSHISPECSSYGQWSMAKVQVKHIMHYLGGLLVFLVCHGFVLFVYIRACVYIEWDSFCSFFRGTRLCLHLPPHTCACRLKPPLAPSLSLSSLRMCWVLCWLCTDCACQAVWVCCNDNGPRSGVSATAEMRIGYF